MLDIQYIRDHADELKTAITNKQFNPDIVDEVLRVDKQRRELIIQVEELRKKSNEHTRSVQGKPTPEQIEYGRQLKAQLQDVEPQLRQVEETFLDLMLQVPNPAAHDVPVAPDESGNQEIFQWGEKRTFDFEPKTHEVLAEELDLFDSKRGVKVGGRRAYFLKNDLVLLEMAVQQFAMKHMVDKGFTPMSVPWMANFDIFTGTGYFPWGKEDHYRTQDDQGLIGTSEVSMTAYHKDEILNEKDLPVKMVALSPCFRREVGSYGKDTQGFFRVHQFQKIEQVVYTIADEEVTRQMHDEMRRNAEEILQALNLPYHVLLMCTGDIGAGQRKKYDIETWFPGQNAYRETHSDSYFNDFQARRLNIRYRAKDGNLKHVYTLNNTVVATPRLLAAILENYQQADGSIEIPEVLKPFMGKDRIVKQK
jgi:seryl-tRNA synthetase